ncbi:trans-aconitate 3-methyltransferase [[Candida] anglica]|uniref:Trans-aconitate 3-methyltransferase n=1 Tax=[Candida] anglica TaxID=148631 RepID=A0ABP0EJ41_9ASCO
MSTYSDNSFNTSHYNLARPSYPDEFYKTLMEYHDSKGKARGLAVDIGCGSGFVTFKLGKYFQKVVGTDISEKMIQQCKEQNESDGVSFCVASAEESPKEILAGTVDLLTGAECCHWVDHPKFFAESYRVLQPGGTLAYWFYKDPIFVGNPVANEIYERYCYGSDSSEGYEKYMGPVWQQPGRDYLRTLLKEIIVPESQFKDVIRHEFHAEEDQKSDTTLYISRRATLKDLLGYTKSWSAYHTWMKLYGADHKDVAERFVDELREAMGWSDDYEFELVWDTVYTFATKR